MFLKWAEWFWSCALSRIKFSDEDNTKFVIYTNFFLLICLCHAMKSGNMYLAETHLVIF
jgi:hypothetical protein